MPAKTVNAIAPALGVGSLVLGRYSVDKAVYIAPALVPAEGSNKTKSKAANMTNKNTGLVFNCYSLRRRMRAARVGRFIRPTSVVYMGAVLEYIMAEVLELAGNCARDSKRKTVKPRHIMMAVQMDDELKPLFSDVILPGGGVVPGVHSCLLGKKDQATFKGWSRQNLSKAQMGVKE
eukprot:GFUD01082337.1.p1 GENE.GFUD01082337.1~~GFUD01082337.1.p1  ORF type:complete len:177 (-),score=56.75 GFUD01082337.1:300-830(-)